MDLGNLQSECPGKTIKDVSSGWQSLFISFTDGTFLIAIADTDYDDSPELKFRTHGFDRTSISDQMFVVQYAEHLVAAEILLQEDVDQVRAYRDKIAYRQNEAEDKATYERLKKRFGD